MLTNWQIALLIGAPIGLILGYFIAQKSEKEKPVRGGRAARVFHYLGASAFVAIAPTALIGSSLYHLNFFPRVLRGLGLGLGVTAVSAVFLILYAAFEAQAAGQQTAGQQADSKKEG